jgi:hypothetical protein
MISFFNLVLNGKRHHLIDLNFLEECISYFTPRVILTYTITSRAEKRSRIWLMLYDIRQDTGNVMFSKMATPKDITAYA